MESHGDRSKWAGERIWEKWKCCAGGHPEANLTWVICDLFQLWTCALWPSGPDVLPWSLYRIGHKIKTRLKFNSRPFTVLSSIFNGAVLWKYIQSPDKRGPDLGQDSLLYPEISPQWLLSPFLHSPYHPLLQFYLRELLLILEAARSCNRVVISSYDLEISEKQVLCHFLRQNLYIEYTLGISTSATLSAMWGIQIKYKTWTLTSRNSQIVEERLTHVDHQRTM